MLDYPALQALATVVREGSFERAAASLRITPSAVSQRVRGLEERLGAILVVRGAPCRPTDLGRTLCAHAERVRLLEADLGLRAEGAGLPSVLKVAVNADSLATWFPRALSGFATTPDVALDLVLDDEAHTAGRLRSGEVVAAVTADPEPVPGCRTLPLGALHYAACASPDFAARFFGGGIDASALARAPQLRFDRRDGLQRRWLHDAHACAPDAPTHWVPSTHGFLDFALAGLAWGLQPVSLADVHLAAGRLVELPPALRISVPLFWTVARLPSASLLRLTESVRGGARAALGPANAD
ncbi:LysR family transcriptional regulator ArgP [Aureimonas sp. AU22]|uniref:LysR family transcriptional regulator ArgP n=1 Tax=Aureimonas sp. AU22 TaxID=1638162 RepID=UPI0007824D86|nr:LysR family transcriptional regulator ArgP [Aureimonas sp. AU22]